MRTIRAIRWRMVCASRLRTVGSPPLEPLLVEVETGDKSAGRLIGFQPPPGLQQSQDASRAAKLCAAAPLPAPGVRGDASGFLTGHAVPGVLRGPWPPSGVGKSCPPCSFLAPTRGAAKDLPAPIVADKSSTMDTRRHPLQDGTTPDWIRTSHLRFRRHCNDVIGVKV